MPPTFDVIDPKALLAATTDELVDAIYQYEPSGDNGPQPPDNEEEARAIAAIAINWMTEKIDLGDFIAHWRKEGGK